MSRIRHAIGAARVRATTRRESVIGRSTRTLVAALSAAAIFAAACGGATTPSSGNQAPAGTGTAGLPQPSSASTTIRGAGATFPTPLYEVWFDRFNEKYSNISIDYQSIGSGGGIKAISEKTVDFGASDAAMKDDELAKTPGPILHIPTALGAVVLTYNLSGVSELKLDGATTAGIFLGTIKRWNDPAIAALNSGVSLPDAQILVVHRSDGSGTTNTFTAYLSAVSSDWKSKVGTGKEVNWPTGIGAQGNDGVAGGVQQNAEAIGYVELNYAANAKLATAMLKNADGQFVAATTEGVTAAADAAAGEFPADFRQAPLINRSGAQTYPIAAYTYLLVYKNQADVEKAKTLVSFMAWALNDGQGEESALGYAPLPGAVKGKAIAALHTITVNGAAVWP
jgi:phosphate transport system substrate-binding protein